MRASVIVYWAAKEGSSATEYEDAWQVLPDIGDEVPGDSVALAVADGATESSLARQWAAMIAQEFAANPAAVHDAGLFAETALALSSRWPAIVMAYTAERENAARPLRWYERRGLEKGAFATLLTLQVNIDSQLAGVAGTPPDPVDPRFPHIIGGWASAALGDTCLFHVRGGQLQAAFPMSESGHFDTSPAVGELRR